MFTTVQYPLDIENTMKTTITFGLSIDTVNWEQLKHDLNTDDFDNGRTPEQLRISFQNSAYCAMAWCGDRVVGTARLLSDGVCNAYLVDVWTLTEHRGGGVATEMIRLLKECVPGQHVYLQADDHLVGFYARLGFAPQPHGLATVVGEWLKGS